MSDHQVIKVHNISKVYKLYERPIDRLKEAVHPFGKKFHQDFYALRNVDITIQKGESVGIIGKNGSGKSTLLKIITGIIPPSSGTLSVAGRISALLELGAGFNPELSGVENVFFSGTLMGYGKEEMAERLPGILAFADIGDYVHQPVKTYSSGMFLRLAFSVASSVDPEILIIDEALSVGDELFQAKCIRRISEIKNRGTTILFVSHSSSTIRQICDSVLLLNEGEVVEYGEPKLVLEAYNSILYGVESGVNSESQKIKKNDLVEDACGQTSEPVQIDFNKIAKIVKTGIRNNEKKIHHYKKGEMVKFYSSVEFCEDSENIIFGTMIYLPNGASCFHTNTLCKKHAPLKIKKGDVVQVEFELKLDLVVGRYLVAFDCQDVSGVKPMQLDIIWDACGFDIVSDKYYNEGGVAALDHDITYEVTRC